MLTADYTAHMYDRDLHNLSSFLAGSGREIEIAVQRNMLRGVRKDDQVVMAPFDTVTMVRSFGIHARLFSSSAA